MPTRYCGILPVSSGNIDDFPLVNARVHYDLVDVQSLASLIQTYTSNALLVVDVKYVFPLPSDASVCAFKCVIDGKRTIKAVVKEKAEAQAEYDEAVSQGKTAALLKQSNVEIFEVSLGNIHPKSTIEIHISFASVVAHNGELDSIRLTFPTAIAPRYGAAVPNHLLDYTTNTRSWFHPLVHSFSSALYFSVAVQMTSHIKSVTSPSHPIAMKMGESTLEPSAEFDPSKARVSLSSPTFLDKDIVIVLTCQDLDKPRCTVESFSPEEGAHDFTDAYALTFVPRFELPPLPSQEFIFLVDRSGSMQGRKIHGVRSALQIMLRSLPTHGTTFNILSFGTLHSSLWATSLAYSADSLRAASEHVDGFKADHGGTEIRSALEAAFRLRTVDINTPTTVFVLTDGQASDLNGVQATISQYVSLSKGKANFLRVFCMGIRNAVSKAMCDVIARAGQGTVVYVGEEEKPDHKLMGLLRAARSATVENLTVDWGVSEDSSAEKEDFDFEIVSSEKEPTPAELPPISLFDESINFNNKVPSGPDITPVKLAPPPTVQQAPATKYLPPIYPGFRTSIFAIVKRANSGNSAPSKVVRISGSVLGRPVTLEVAVMPIVASKEPLEYNKAKVLHVLAARALVQRFEDEGKASIMTRELKAEVLRIAERYGIASSETSFVAVDESGITIDVVQPALMASLSGRSGRGGSYALQIMTSTMTSSNSGNAPSQSFLDSSLSGRSGGVGSYTLQTMRPMLASSDSGNAPSQIILDSFESGLISTAQSHSSSDNFLRIRQETSAVLAREVTAPSLTSPRFYQNILARKSQRSSSIKNEVKRSSVLQQSDSAEQPRSLSPTIESFARSQSFEGSFDGCPALYQLLVNQSDAPSRPDILGGEVSDLADKIWCTLLCVAYMETKLSSEREVWGIMVEKAMSWVEEALQSVLGADNLAVKKEALTKYAKNCIRSAV